MGYDILKFREINRPLAIPIEAICEQTDKGITIVTSKLSTKTFVQTQQIMHEENMVQLEYSTSVEKQLAELRQEVDNLARAAKEEVRNTLDLSDLASTSLLKNIISRQQAKCVAEFRRANTLGDMVGQLKQQTQQLEVEVQDLRQYKKEHEVRTKERQQQRAQAKQKVTESLTTYSSYTGAIKAMVQEAQFSGQYFQKQPQIVQAALEKQFTSLSTLTEVHRRSLDPPTKDVTPTKNRNMLLSSAVVT
eukprot:Gb_06820 [translate_table: standard]